MNTGLFLLLNLLACGLFYRFVLYRSNEENPERKQEYNQEISERIRRISELDEKIQALQELITDIDLSDSDRLKNISLEWETTAGKNLTADMWLDGQSDVTKQMRILAGEQLDELTTSLFDEIEKL